MLNPGEKVDAEVESVKAYGAFLRRGDDRILVLAVETGDTAQQSRNAMATLGVGETVTVRVLRYVAEDDVYVGTLKSAYVTSISSPGHG
jgi:hypothetical protein